MQAGLVGEARIGRHHHIGGGVGLGQPSMLHQATEVGGGAHLQLAPFLFAAQLRFRARRELTGVQGGHGPDLGIPRGFR